MIRFRRRAWQSALAFWVIVTGGALLFPEPRVAKAVAAPGLENVRALMAARSPGTREDGALYQTKLAYLDHYESDNHERSLGEGRYHPGGGAGGGGNPVGGVAGGTDGLPTPGGAGDGGGGIGDDPVGPGASFADSSGTLFPALGGLVGGGSGGAGGGGTPTPPPSAVALPEPATWLAMILGLFAVGIGMRRRPIALARSFR